jgi:hypothetical protein
MKPKLGKKFDSMESEKNKTVETLRGNVTF